MRIKIQIPNKSYVWLKGEIEKKINLTKWQKNKRMRIKIDIKNKKKIYDWMVKLKRRITFPKWSKKKLEIKIMRTMLENIMLSIWIEWWN
jgi:hypothetical protein